jgi:hypothetical protein
VEPCSSNDVGRLSSDPKFPSRGAVWINKPASALQRIDCSQHRGGLRQKGNGEFSRFLQIASGSASELDYELLLARDLAFLQDTEYGPVAKQLAELRRMLTALILRVESERCVAKC